MKLNQEHIEFENKCNSIKGFLLEKVEYYVIDFNQKGLVPTDTKYPEIDSIDFSIIMFTDKAKLEFYWDGQFYQFGIGLKINEPSEFSEYKKVDVSEKPLWKVLINRKISNIGITWEEVITTDNRTRRRESFIYPQDIRIGFENSETIFISAAGFLEPKDDEVYGMLDNLTATRNESLARQVKMI